METTKEAVKRTELDLTKKIRPFTINIPQTTLDEAPVPRLEEATGEQHEPWRPRAGLGGEQHLGLLAPAHRRRRLSGRLPGVEISPLV